MIPIFCQLMTYIFLNSFHLTNIALFYSNGINDTKLLKMKYKGLHDITYRSM